AWIRAVRPFLPLAAGRAFPGRSPETGPRRPEPRQRAGSIGGSRMTPVFLFVDLLEDFFARPPHSTRRRELVLAANELVGIARDVAAPIIWVRQEFEPDLSDAFLSMRRTGRRVTIRGTPGCRLLAELDRRPEDHEIVKKRYSAF